MSVISMSTKKGQPILHCPRLITTQLLRKSVGETLFVVNWNIQYTYELVCKGCTMH